MPGGFIEPDETIERAVVREVAEEAGVTAEVQGILGVRNRYDPDVGNSLYIVLLMNSPGGEPKPDQREVDEAGFFTLEEIHDLEQVPPINVEIAKRALALDHRLLAPMTVNQINRGSYTLFVG